MADEKGQYRATVVELPRETIEKIASDLNVSDISRIPNKIVFTGVGIVGGLLCPTPWFPAGIVLINVLRLLTGARLAVILGREFQ